MKEWPAIENQFLLKLWSFLETQEDTSVRECDGQLHVTQSGRVFIVDARLRDRAQYLSEEST